MNIKVKSDIGFVLPVRAAWRYRWERSTMAWWWWRSESKLVKLSQLKNFHCFFFVRATFFFLHFPTRVAVHCFRLFRSHLSRARLQTKPFMARLLGVRWSRFRDILGVWSSGILSVAHWPSRRLAPCSAVRLWENVVRWRRRWWKKKCEKKTW